MEDNFSPYRIPSGSNIFPLNGDGCLTYIDFDGGSFYEDSCAFQSNLQRFDFVRGAEGVTRRFKLFNQNVCIDDHGGSDKVGPWSCNGGSNQKWLIVPAERYTTNLVAYHNGVSFHGGTYLVTGGDYCLTRENGYKVKRCTGVENQVWFFN